MSDVELRRCVLLSVQRALLDAISPSLRAVAVNWDNGQFTMRCFFDPAPTEEEWDDMNVVEGEVAADLPLHFKYERQLLEVSGPLPKDPDFVWVFSRKEPGSQSDGHNRESPASPQQMMSSTAMEVMECMSLARGPEMAWTDIKLRRCVFLSVQRSLLWRIGPSLRTVAVNCDKGLFTMMCSFDAAPTEEDWEDMKKAETEVMVNLPEHFKSELQLLEVSGRVPNVPGFSLVFAKKEPEYLEGYT